MKENKYDELSFFEKYSKMNRSIHGLSGAGEWPELKKLLPDFEGKTVLDLGCGYGWHCEYAASNGARKVIGVDLSEKMLAVANEKNHFSNVTYSLCAMEEVAFEKGEFDMILSSLAFHYVKEFQELITRIHEMLAPQGKLIFSVEHPIFTAYGTQDWYYDENGEILHFPVDHYFREGERKAIFLGESVTKYHRTLQDYLGTLLHTGFIIKEIVEPKPPADMMHLPGMEDELRRPMMLLISAEKI